MKAEAVRCEIIGRVKAPSSKSAVQRYIAASLLSEGRSIIDSVTLCDDSVAAMEIARSLGAEINYLGNAIEIKGGFKPVTNEISCGESGLSARMFTPIAAIYDREITISGRGSIMKRPFDMVEGPLKMLGGKVRSNNGYLPVTVQGPLRGGEVTADGSVSSQFITGLLMALPRISPDSILRVDNLVSKPYIDLTLKILSEYGVEIINENYRRFIIRGGQSYQPGSFSAEGDWSGGAFLLVMGALAGEVTIEGLDRRSPQADKAVMEALELAGARIKHSENGIQVSHSGLRSFEFDISDCPDLAPPLAVLALACAGKTFLKGAGRLAAKESNRGAALEESLTAIGAKVVNHGDRLEIDGGMKLRGGTAGSFNDHRIAMALAIAALLCESPVIIDGMDCINKSYPGFMDDYNHLGGRIKIL